MPNLQFTNVALLNFGRSQEKATASFEASLTAQIIKAMEWQEIGSDKFKDVSLEGKISATDLQLIPVEPELKKHAVSLTIGQTSEFKAIRLENEGKRQKHYRYVLRFKVILSDQSACKKLEGYMQTVGAGKTKMAISYEKQTELDISTGADEQEEFVADTEEQETE